MAPANNENGGPDHLVQVAARGAFRLVVTQNDDGGWDWMNPNTNPNQGSPSPYNTLGVTALGLAVLNGRVPNSAQLAACTDTFRAIVTNSRDPNSAKHRIRGPDITFLAELSKSVKPAGWAGFTVSRWVSAMDEFGGGTATGFGEYIRDARKGQNYPSLVSWDNNLYIQGLLALERVSEAFGGLEASFARPQARELAEVIYDSLYVPPIDFDISDDTQNEFWVGITGALEAFVTTGLHKAEATALAAQLVGGQKDDGHFMGVGDGSDAQTTAYAVSALVKAGELRAAAAAVNFLVGSQLPCGGWLYDGGENTEVTSEVVCAILEYMGMTS